MLKPIKGLSPGRVLAVGFALLILLGSALLILPCSVKEGVMLRYIDSLYTAASAVCVTGLATVDPGSTFTPFGQLILGLLIQMGGLGVASCGAGVILAMRKKLDLKGRNLVKEAMNVSSGGGIVRLTKVIFLTTVIIEFAGAVLCFPVFVRDYPPLAAAGISLFHSVATFNNSGFDIFGGGQSLIPYCSNIPLNLITSALIFLGGVGFLVIQEIIEKRFRWKRFSMHTKVVLSFSLFLIIAGTVFFKLSENMPLLSAFFMSVSARTAGFSTYPLSSFSGAGLLVMILLMIIGASPGSTGGGIKTTTFFVLLQGIKSAATNKSEKCFHYSIPANAFRKASVIFLMALGVVFTGTCFLCIFEPQLSLRDALFEIASAFGTVGLSTGITSGLHIGGKLLSILIMYIGRLGPMTVATLWYFNKGERVRYPDGNISIG